MLYIAEKPELARAIADALGSASKKVGYYFCGGDLVTWCYGHMLQLYNPEDYNPDLAKWKLEHLPMFFVPWRKKPVAKTKEQLIIILGLLKEAKIVVNAGDPDSEGQLLVDEILAYADFKGPVKRVLINDNTPALVKKALANLRDNSDFRGLSLAAEARQIGDQMVGFNLTRLYTLTARKQGYNGVLSVGRVQTPILGLVVRRDREHADHQAAHYYSVKGEFDICGVRLNATYQVKPEDPVDASGRLNNETAAAAIAQAVANKPARLTNSDTGQRQTPPPLPYNLLKLQADASRLYGITPDRTKEITQALREKHRLITYNRSDSQYLSDEQHADAAAVIGAVTATLPELTLGMEFDPTLKSRAFNTAKVSAHHAIIPTQARVNAQTLTEDERKIYTLIARVYLAQFMPNVVYEHTTVTLSVGDYVFTASGRETFVTGWKKLFGSEAGPDPDDASEHPTIATLCGSEDGQCFSCTSEKHATAPRPLYTTASLLEDLTRVAQYVRDDQLRAILIEKDKGKAGEHGGIGTPATRDTVLKTLFDRGFLEMSGKNIVSTVAGRDFYDALPESVVYPDMTALWHQEQLEIERGEKDLASFVEGIQSYIAGEVEKVRTGGISMTIENKHPCPACGGALVQRKGAKGQFWGCGNFPDCKTVLPDEDGKPGTKRPKPITSELHTCTTCGKGLKRRKTKDGKHFWGCSDFPACKRTYPDLNGKPNFDIKPKESK